MQKILTTVNLLPCLYRHTLQVCPKLRRLTLNIRLIIAGKTQLRRDINFCIKSASSYEEFLLLMWAKGYEIKGETFGEDAVKYISFRPLDKERFVRGSTRSLGKAPVSVNVFANKKDNQDFVS